MQHIFIEGKNKEEPTLLLLHGTGGNERDLIPLAQTIAPNASILGVKGNIMENGMPRFFRRLAEGIFDEEDLIFRTKELHEELNKLAEEYSFDRNKVVAIGYSNGANIAASLLYHYQHSIQGAILFHAMVPLRNISLPNLAHVPVFIGAGKNDPLIPMKETEELIDNLKEADAAVTEHWGEGGHQLTREEVVKATTWYTRYYANNK